MRGFLDDDPPRRSDRVAIKATLIRQTDIAFHIDTGSRRAWVPKSLADRDGDTFTMPERLALEKGLI